MVVPARPTDWRQGAAVAETHISIVFFVGDRAYKLLKPVHTDFLDHSTPERRQAAARREVELNSRVAPDVYLGVAQIDLGDGEAEPAIVMRRMPADRRLEDVIDRGDEPDCLRAVARAVASLHASAPPLDARSAAAALDAVPALWRGTIEECLRLADLGPIDPERLVELGRLGTRYLAGRTDLLEARLAAGHLRDGHGDLQAADIFCLDDGPRILDCLAFDDALRHGDVLADIAFLAMDLERLGHAAAAETLMRRYREFSFEHHPRSLEHHYVAYRALVRTKVALLRAEQGDAEAGPLARAYLHVAEARLRRGRVRLVLVGGAPGVGKSTLAQSLSDATGASLLRSDELRKDLAGMGHAQRADADFGEGLYRPEMTDRVYGKLIERAGELLGLGRSVILDASWSSEAARADARLAAARTESEVIEIRADCPPEVAAARIRARRAGGRDASDADVTVAAELRERFEPWPTARGVDTSQSPEDATRQAVAVVGPF